MFLTVPATLSDVNEDIDREALAERLRDVQRREGWDDTKAHITLGVNRTTFKKLRDRPELPARAASVRTVLAALNRLGDAPPPAPSRRIARSDDLSWVDDDALIAELAQRLHNRRPNHP